VNPLARELPLAPRLLGVRDDVPHDVSRDAQKCRAKQELEAKLREAIASGSATPMTREDGEGLEREVLARLDAERVLQ
jgi:hypothetical protein